jgi:hypothetical protein
MATMNLKDQIIQAIDKKDARAAGLLVDVLRDNGWTYRRILAKVQSVRPAVTAGEWDDLCAEADDLDAHDGEVCSG